MSNAHKMTARGIVLGNRTVGEGSVRVDFYTDMKGLVRALATSAREERSQLRAHLQEGTAGSYTFVAGEHTWRVIGAFKTANIYFTEHARARAAASASRVIGIVRQLIRGEGSDPYLFATLWEFFAALSSLDDEAARDAECIAVIRILSSLGYVENAPSVCNFLGSGYKTFQLEEARHARSHMVRVINEGIAASGL